MSKLDSLQREYDDLSQRCGVFDQETINLRRDREEQHRKWAMDRKRERQELVARKGRVFEQLKAAKAEQAGEVVAEEALKPDAAAIQSAKPAEPAIEEKLAETLPGDLKDETVAKDEEKIEDAPVEQAQEKLADPPARPATPPPAQQRQPHNGRGRNR